MIVMKFGGTSVGSAEAIRRVGGIIASRLEKKPIVVSSATAKTTDELVKFYQEAVQNHPNQTSGLIEWIVQKHVKIIEELGLEIGLLQPVLDHFSDEMKRLDAALRSSKGEDRSLVDQCLSLGEFLSCNILVCYLKSRDIDAEWVDARQVVVTDSRFSRASPSFAESQPKAKARIEPLAARNIVPVIQGFVGADPEGRTTTLGRGGSDYSATFVGALLGVGAVEVWTDVDGILTGDPSLIPEAKRICRMTFEEAAELAYFGAKVLHPATLLPAVDRGIPVLVLNSMRPAEPGTEIVAEQESTRSAALVKSIAYKEGLSVLHIRSSRMLMAYGFLSSIFEVFNRFETPIDLVATSEVGVSVTIDSRERLDEILEALSAFAEIEVRHNRAVVCLVGENLLRSPGTPARVFAELEDIRISLISQGGSKINISFVVDEADLPVVIDRLHRKFFSGDLDPEVFAV